MDRRFLVGFSGVASLLLMLTAVMPLADQRNSRIDSFIADDLASISQSIDEYVGDENKLPRDLGELNLDEDVENRSESYSYEYSRSSSSSFSAEYELCAEFRTDTTDDDTDDEFGIFDALTGTVPRNFGSSTDFTRHKQGRDCFDVNSNSFNPFSSGFDSSSSPVFDADFETIQ